jgi:hypothetical protein
MPLPYLTGIPIAGDEFRPNDRRSGLVIAREVVISSFGRLALEGNHVPVAFGKGAKDRRLCLVNADCPAQSSRGRSHFGRGSGIQASCAGGDLPGRHPATDGER